MFFHLTVFLHSLFFLLIIEIASSEAFSHFLADNFDSTPKVFVFLGVLLLGYFFKVAQKIGKKIELTPIPVLMVFASFLLLYFIDAPLQRHAFSVLTAAAYYFLHLGLHRLKLYAKDKTAYAIISAAAVATIFLFYAGAYGVYLNFDLPLWFLMLVFFVVTTLVSYQYFFLIIHSPKEILKYSILLGFVMMEIAWGINFWPFGYLTTGVITLIFYYVFWDIIQAHLLEELTKKRLINDLVSSGLLITLVLLTSRWVAVV